MKIENWCDYDIRFINIDGELWVILKNICDVQCGKFFMG